MCRDGLGAAMCFREIATNFAGDRCAAADTDGFVTIWRIPDGSVVSRFRACYSPGGERIAISEDGATCATADWRRGLVAYDSRKGSIAWRRDDLRHVQHVAFDVRRSLVSACVEGGDCHVLEAPSGRTVATLPDVRRRHASPIDAVVFLEDAGPLRAPRGRPCHSLQPHGSAEPTIQVVGASGAILSVSFGPGVAFLAEACFARSTRNDRGTHVLTGEFDPPDGGPLRAIDVRDGRVRWDRRFGPGRHLVRLAYSPATRQLRGILQWESGRAVETTLLSLDAESGNVVGELEWPLRGSATAFARHGDMAITADGELLDLTRCPPVRLRRLE